MKSKNTQTILININHGESSALARDTVAPPRVSVNMLGPGDQDKVNNSGTEILVQMDPTQVRTINGALLGASRWSSNKHLPFTVAHPSV